MDYKCVILGCQFAVFGLIVALRGIHAHLSVRKENPENGKKQKRIELFFRDMGCAIMLNGLVLFLSGLWSGFTVNWFVVAMAVWIFVAGFNIWHISKGGGAGKGDGKKRH